jgi:PAS domain S-box-containing protein
MSKPLSCLMVEDSEDDALLVLRQLRSGGYEVTSERVETADAMRAALDRRPWDVVISDYKMPHFSGIAALEVLKATGKDLPFIIVSGTIGEDVAVGAMKAGAHDYIMKGRLARLVPVLERELRDATGRRERRQAGAALQVEQALFNDLISAIPDHIYFKDLRSRFVRINDAMARFFGLRSAHEAVGKSDSDFFSTEHAQGAYEDEQRVMSSGEPIIDLVEKETWPDGHVTWVSSTKVPQRDAHGRITGLIGISRDVTGRRQTEERLHLMASALSSAANAIVISDRTGAVEWVNSAYSTLTGYSSTEAIGHNPRELVKSGKHGDAFYKELWTTILAGRVWQNETINRRKNGSLYTEFQTITPVRDEGGEVSHFITIKEDITERKEAESRIRYLNRSYATLSAINKSLVRHGEIRDSFRRACHVIVEIGGFRLAWIGMLDPQSGILRSVSHAGAGDVHIDKLPFASGGNLSEPGITAESRRMLVRVICNDIEHDPRMGASRDEALRMGYRSMALFPLVSGDTPCGTINFYSDKVNFFSEDEINLLDEIASDLSYAVVVSEQDVMRQKAEARIHEQAEVINLAPVAVIISDPSGVVTYCNEGAANIYFGKKPEALLGRIVFDLFPQEASKILATGRNAVLTTGSWRGELTLAQPEGQRVVLDVIMRLIRDPGGRPLAWLSVAVDVTEKRQFEEQALRAQRIENLGTLAAGIAHDFNNALAPIIMAGPLLQKMVRDPAAQKMINIVNASSARSAALVRQMLSFARGTSGEKQLTQIRHVLREVIDLCQSTFPKSIRIESHVPNDLWPILGDPTQMHQIFLNLCVNARDAMPGGGELKIVAANCALDAARAARIEGGRVGNFLAIEVRDTGTGISPDVLGKIYEPFFTTKGIGKGTGLGLSTVRGIVSHHDGLIDVQSSTNKDRGHGTVFTVYLPAAPGEATVASATPGKKLPQGRGELILFVDDEEAVRELGTRILVGQGYEVITASDGANAISTFAPHASQVRLLVTDLDMPVVGGRELALALRRMNPRLPVIVISGGMNVPETGLRNFATTVLPKPFDAQTLLEIVRHTLDEVGSAHPFPSAT